jgi:DNA-binding PadR family transcriptional regulator
MGASLLEYHVLLALASGALHGYAIAERVAAESGGALRPRAGSLYRVIARLISSGLVTESEAHDDVAHPGLARRYYALTGAGRRTLGEEARRLKQVAAVAEKRLGLARGRS